MERRPAEPSAGDAPYDLPQDSRPGTLAGSTPSARRDIRLFWWAGTSDALGSQASGLVLPLLLLSLGHSPAEVGAVAGLSAAATLLLGPLAAVPADRGARKRVMVGSAVVSAASMTVVTAAAWSGSAPLAVLLAVVLVERSATACYETASLGTVALVCAPADHRRVLSRLQAGERAALVLGPALGGLLFHTGRWLPFLADAVSYVVAAVCIGAMRAGLSPRHTGRPAAGGPSRPWRTLAAEAGAGLGVVRREPFLRLALVWIAAVNAVLAALYYTAVFALQDHGRGAAPLGVVLALAGAAGLAGSLAAPRLAGRRTATQVLGAVSWLLVPPAAALAVARDAWQFGLLFGLLCALTPLATVALQARVLQVVPPELQARTGTVLATASGAAAAVAPAIAGLVTDQAGTVAMSLGCAVVLAGLALYATCSPASRHDTVASRPGPQESPTTPKERA
ncbi:MFS transporter [Streptomyces endophytica]|uniref:MFS transporter n=1 Tax=Streptomyces endophytica TaxID=2991496 RepID=A0ABY6PGP5_9ACTN|nr:MFS transporter [Streptomyces endophytica]UZJ32717.1 MFS transporter [Streptomyces endophytica]